MRIDAYSAISNVYTNKGKIKANSVSNVSAGDKVEISQFGREYQIAKNAVKAAPDIREDKVAEIKAKMSSGNYNVTAKDLAEKLVENF